MLKRLLPRQDTFFQLFMQAVDKLVLASSDFSKLLQDLPNQQYYVDQIAKHEEEADQIAHASFELLHKTFITPFDRHDIHELTSSMDDIIDLINHIAQRFPFYQLKFIPEEIIHLAQLCIEATHYLKTAIYSLHSLKNSEEIFKLCAEIDDVESKANLVLLAGEKKLFLDDLDYKQFFKLKEIYSYTKSVINYCQDVANILKGIVLEYS